MRTIATNGVARYVCLLVGHNREPCINGRANRDAVWAANSRLSKPGEYDGFMCTAAAMRTVAANSVEIYVSCGPFTTP